MTVRLDSTPFLFGKMIHPLVTYWRKNLIKIACSFDEGPSLVESFFETIFSSHFVRESLQKSDFIVNGEKPIWKSQEVMAKLGIVLDLRINA